MTYVKTNWENRIVERPKTFRQQQNADGTITLIPEEGSVIKEGTPVNASNMNKIENEIVVVGSQLVEINKELPKKVSTIDFDTFKGTKNKANGFAGLDTIGKVNKSMLYRIGDIITTGNILREDDYWLKCVGQNFDNNLYKELSAIILNAELGEPIIGDFIQRVTNFITTINAICYGNGLFVMATEGDMLTSTDGITWNRRIIWGKTTYINDICYGNGMFVAVGGNDGIATSTDGITWTKRTTTVNNAGYFACVCYGNGLYIAGTTNGKMATSINGTTWEYKTSPVTTGINTICYGNGLFVMGVYITGILTSADGITWTRRTSVFDSRDIKDICYGNGVFVAVGGVSTIATSTDGITWITRTTPLGSIDISLNTVCYSNGMFIAGGNVDRLIISLDGITWSIKFKPLDGSDIKSSCYANGTLLLAGVMGSLLTTHVGAKLPNMGNAYYIRSKE